MGDDRAIVVTTDFFTPIVDDPYDYGSIAAANSLSDIYAMGGNPFLALNVAALPDDLPMDVAQAILRGGAEKAREAGVVIAGGHTVKDDEPKYGLVVLGWVDPRRLLRKSGLVSGDSLFLTKPLGFGVTTTALKQQRADSDDIAEATAWMKKLNRGAAELALEFSLMSATDITGFGLLGHSLEMAEASEVAIRLNYRAIPFLNNARRYAEAGMFPGGAFDNNEFGRDRVEFDATIDDPARMLLFDPQTSGGLLLAVPASKRAEFSARANAVHQPLWEVGRVEAGAGIRVTS